MNALLLPLDMATRLGEMVVFAWRALLGLGTALRHYRGQIGRVIAEVTLGSGIFVVGGGVVGVVLLLSTLTGTQVGLEGHNGLEVIGLAPLTGFVSGYANTRELAPMVAALGFASRIGCGFTSRIGAMRINEEIDALESMGIQSVEYLVSTRLVAGMVAITPLYSIAVILSFLASEFVTVALFGQSAGLYRHYFTTFLNPLDLMWSFLQAVLMAITILLIHTYFGYFAQGGPSGVGVAVGNAVRTSLIVVVSVTLLVSLAIYGSDGNFNLSG